MKVVNQFQVWSNRNGSEFCPCADYCLAPTVLHGTHSHVLSMQMKSINGPLGCWIRFQFPVHTACGWLLFLWVYPQITTLLLYFTLGYCGTLLYVNKELLSYIIYCALRNLFSFSQWLYQFIFQQCNGSLFSTSSPTHIFSNLTGFEVASHIIIVT